MKHCFPPFISASQISESDAARAAAMETNGATALGEALRFVPGLTLLDVG